jgi:hypothetical protein
MVNSETYRARIRFRIAKKLKVTENDYSFAVAGRNVLLQPQNDTVAIQDSEWLIVNTRGFADDADARTFGRNLQTSLHLASAVTRLGLDPGIDLPTSGLSDQIKKKITDETGVKVRDNVHGLDIFIDDPNVRVFSIQATGTIRANPDPFLSLAATLHNTVDGLSKEARDVILLLNFALMRPEPVAQIIFCISAVEMLGQEETWSDAQKALLNVLAESVKSQGIATEQERKEISDAIKRGMHRISLRQGVFRLLDRLSLSDLRKSWDEVYKDRSKLVHGLAPAPGARYDELAFRTVNLCGRILLMRVAQEVPAIKEHFDVYYPLSPKQGS